MPDCVATTITIGGPITRQGIETLAKAIHAEGAGIDWSGCLADEHEAIAAIEDAIKAAKSLCLSDAEAPWGSFPYIIEACVELDLAYSQHNDGKYEIDAMYKYWRPGMEEARYCASDNDGSILCSVETVNRHMADGTMADFISELKSVVDIPPMTLAIEPAKQEDTAS